MLIADTLFILRQVFLHSLLKDNFLRKIRCRLRLALTFLLQLPEEIKSSGGVTSLVDLRDVFQGVLRVTGGIFYKIRYSAFLSATSSSLIS